MKTIKEIQKSFNIIKNNCGCNGVTKIHCETCPADDCKVYKALQDIQELINNFAKLKKEKRIIKRKMNYYRAHFRNEMKIKKNS